MVCVINCASQGWSKDGLVPLLITHWSISLNQLCLVVNDIFGNTDNNSETSQNKSEEQEKENVIENYKEPYSWSPYSYSSFLSELYTVANNEKLQS